MKPFRIFTSLALVVAAAAAQSMNAQTSGAAGVAAIASPYAVELVGAFESLDNVVAARDAMRAVYGERPAYYEPTLRLAWLSLRLGDYVEAEALYRRAQVLPGAQELASSGLALALNGQAYEAFARGSYGVARAAWNEALKADPSAAGVREGLALVGHAQQASAEIWKSAATADLNASSATINYLHIAMQFDPELGARLAYRGVGGATSTTGTTGLFGSQHEWYIGVVRDIGRSTIQGMGFTLSNVLGRTNGAALSWRFGGRTGVTSDVVAMSKPGATNAQFAPSVYRWMTPNLLLSIGTRITSDSGTLMTSALFGATATKGRVALGVRAHAGRDRSAYDVAGPTILSFRPATTTGGTLTLSARLATPLDVYAQGEYEAFADPAINGKAYHGVAVGLRYTLFDNGNRKQR